MPKISTYPHPASILDSDYLLGNFGGSTQTALISALRSAFLSGSFGCRIFNNANFQLPNGVSTPQPFNTTIFDTSPSAQMHFTASANLTGTVTKTAGSPNLVGSATLFTTQLAVGQVISVPGGAAELAVITSIADNTHLVVAHNFANSASGQTASTDNTCIVAPVSGVYLVGATIEIAYNATGVRSLSIYSGPAPGTLSQYGSDDRNAAIASSAPIVISSSTLISLAQWDVIRFLGYQNSGGGLASTVDPLFSPTAWAMKLPS